MHHQKKLTPISGKLIKKWVPDAKIMKYSELKNYNMLPRLPIVLLYEVKPNYGHWVTILRTPEGIEHFDSYGYAPDNELGFIPDEFKGISNQNKKYLLNLLYNSGENINFNQHNLQKERDAATCGRWSILRNLFNYLTTDEFAHTVEKTSKQLGISTDDLVTLAI